ncbi:PAS domain S-box protein [Mariprofundus erugo]|uniref:PAS domain S-box protein n=1 Tax=Mariprofundus erugo TaxID=2528639 RepID=UPI00159C733A|nr:PAS domain S-box protein [Mariprofundus erugo]
MKPVMMRLHFLVLLLLLMVVVWQFRQVQDFTDDLTHRVHTDLEQIISLDARSEVDMLLLQNHRVSNYDQLTEDLIELNRVYKQLEINLAGMAEMTDSLQTLKATIVLQTKAAEAFKSDLGILLNSQRYLPVLINQISEQKPGMRVALTQLNRDLFEWLLEPNNSDLFRSISQQQVALKEAGLVRLEHHADVLLHYAPRIREHVDAVAHCGTPESIALVATRFDMLYGRQLQAHQTNRLWLTALVMALLAYLALLLYRLSLSMRNIHAANVQLSELQQQLEQDLQARTEAEQRFRQLFESIPDAVGVHREGKWLYVNPAAVAMFGAKATDELVGSSVLERVYEEDRPAFVRQLQRYVSDGNGSPLLVQRNLRMDGTVFTGEVRGVPFVEAGETVVLEVVRDISDRLDVENRYSKLVASSSAAIMTYADGHFLSANPATLSMFGVVSEEDFRQLLLADLSPSLQPDGRDSTKAIAGHIRAAMTDGASLFTWICIRSSGETFPVQVQLTALELDGQPVLQWIVTDLSEFRQMQAEKARLVAALQYSAEAVIISDTEARIQYVNPAFERLTGFTFAEVEGGFASVLRTAGTDTAIYEKMLATVNGGKVWKGEMGIRRKSGEEILTDRSIAPIFDEQGKVVSHVAMLRDVTEEKQQAQKLEHTQRLESLGILAGGIAHDFNNILTAIMGNAAMAERALDMASPARVLLGRIEESSRRASELCRQMLAYSGKGKFVVKPLNISSLVMEMTRLMEVSISKNVVLKYHLCEQLPLIEADAAQIQQVVLNLITNASEAIGEKSGVIGFTTGVMHADASYLSGSVARVTLPEGRYVFLEVSDTGCGMDAATVEKIFDPFFTTKFTGRGLGMSAVLGIVRGHHGALRVYSEPGRGTTFKLLLPVMDEPMEALAADHTGEWAAPVGDGVVLVVDDEETIREVAAMMLEDMGFETMTAEDGQDAVEVYRQHGDRIVAVLLDMTMPRMDGSECFRELRRINADVKVVLSSGYNEEEATTRFLGKGLAGFLQKPYSPAALRETMADIIR